jgi:glycosyltransferase involved in cell wall biosynthesis
MGAPSVNLAILIARFPPGALGGAERQAEGWATRLADRHRVTVIARAEPGLPPGRTTRDGYSLIRLPFGGPPLVRTWADVRATARAVAALTPRPDLTLCFQTFVSGLAGVEIKRRLGIPCVVWIRGDGEYRGPLAWRARLVGPRVWSAADVVLVQSEGNRRALIDALRAHHAHQAEAIERRIQVVENGLDLPPLPAAPRPEGPVLTVGRLIADKGMDLLIEALRGGGRALVIAGTGPERRRLEDLARQAGVAVRFEGFVAQERLGQLYRECSCVVLASRRGEGLPNVLLEAMGHARPVVATRVSGNQDLIVDGENGLLVPPGRADSLREALGRLDSDPALAAKLGARARATAESFGWDRVRPRLEAVIERCAA